MRSPNHKHLGDTLNSKFIVPILLGISLSLILTCTCLILLISNSMKQQKNKELVEQLQFTESQPLLLASETLILENYQVIINALAKIESYTNFLNASTYIGEINSDVSSKTKMKQFIDSKAFNAYEMRSNRKDEAQYLIGNKTNFDYSLWIVYKRINSIQQVASDHLLLKLMYLFANLNPLFNSIYETLNVNAQRITRIYIAVPEKNLFYKYPLFFDKDDEIDFSGSWCVDDNNMLPLHYYFQCRHWFVEAYRMFNEHKVPISITEPRFISDNTFEVTICLLSTGPIDLIYCIDALQAELNRKLHSINNLLTGYIFVMRVESKLPIYYPCSFEKGKTDLDFLEFPLNMQFSLNELLLFNATTFNDYIGYNSNRNEPRTIKKGKYLKNGELWQYTVIPLYYYYDYLDQKKHHLLNLIYVENTESYLRSIERLLTYDFTNIFSPIFIYAIQGLILVLISKYLVNAIASSIVLPMKNIKKTLEKLNTKRTASERKLPDKSDIHGDDHNGEYKDAKVEEEEGDEEDDEEYINERSQDIQDLFVRIIELKDSLATLNLRNEAITTRCLPNYLFATEIFKQRKKTNAYLTCNSNVGNLLINCDKYDIAIMHLIESENNDLIQDKSNNQLKIKIDYDGNSISPQEDKTAQEKIKNMLESRYPKLIYCFKQYFSNIKKLNKENKANIELQSTMELYASSTIHHFKLYDLTLKKYQELSRSSNQAIHLIYANLEYIEYYIKYEIKNKSNGDVLPLLKTLFEETELKIKEKKHFLKPKRVYKSLLDINAPVDSIEIAKDILLQRLYYLQGYLAICCKNYHSAIDFLFKVTEAKNTISDAKIVVQSFKKLVKLAKIYRREYTSTAFYLEKNLLDKFILNKKKEIQKFVSEEKDFLIIINSYTNGNSTFIKAAFDKAKLIYENYVCTKDRFGILLFGNDNINLITKLEFINSDRSEYFLQLLHQYGRDEDFSKNSQTDEEEDIESLLIQAKSYISKKSLFENRKLVIIVLSHNFSQKSADYLCSGKISHVLKKKTDHLVIAVQNATVGPNETEINPQLMAAKNNNSFEIQKIENVVHNLKSLLRIYGNIHDYSSFSMEKSSNLTDFN